MVFLSALRRRPDAAIDPATVPWSLPLVRDLETLEFTTPITFLVGENGSGKSTLLEGIAVGMDAVAAGAHDLQRDPTLQAARDFRRGLRVRRVGAMLARGCSCAPRTCSATLAAWRRTSPNSRASSRISPSCRKGLAAIGR